LKTYNEADAIRPCQSEQTATQSTVRLENRPLPPIVRILSPTNFTEISSTTVTLTYQAFSPGGEEIKQVFAFLIDGRPVETQRALKKTVKPRRLKKCPDPIYHYPAHAMWCFKSLAEKTNFGLERNLLP
jgi:hypothetical protein